MSFTLTRFVARMIRNERDFSFIDKIGSLTNALIALIPNTELQRNGQYGALVIVNATYKFEAQITQNEINVIINVNQNLLDDDMKTLYETIIDIFQKILSTIKRIMNYTNDLKSIICQVEGTASTDRNEYIETKIKECCRNAIINNEEAEMKQVSFVWNDRISEKYVSITKGEEGYKYIFAIQDYGKHDMAFSNVRTVMDYCFRDFKERIIPSIEG
jgi:hypothetical protein